MKLLWEIIGRLARWQQLIIGGLVLLIILTWLSVCLILASYLVA
jgi:hypothetical protein